MQSLLLRTNQRTKLVLRGFAAVANSIFQMDYEQVIRKISLLLQVKPTFRFVQDKDSVRRDPLQLNAVYDYLARTGVSKEKLDKLSVIHITGTKGKGSTSAFCESILRTNGYRTGFYSSPHLVTVRERIRINGNIIDKERFTEHFNDVYAKLYITKKHDDDMPGFFCFLTVLAFNVFLKETIDVVILEVGIGGLLDYTNVVRNVPSVGISSLGLDHMNVLGNTIEEIACEKAGIMKPGCTAYTVDQPANALAVLRSVADDVKCPLHIVPTFDSYKWENNHVPKLLVDLPEYKANASLAIQLSHSWMKQNRIAIINKNQHQCIKYLNNASIENRTGNNENGPAEYSSSEVTTYLPKQTADGLAACYWPGRFQIIPCDYANFYLDGAHTVESIEVCMKWFTACSRSSQKILIFNVTGTRNPETLMKLLSAVKFDNIYFSPNISTNANDLANEIVLFQSYNKEEQIIKCKTNFDYWKCMAHSTTNLQNGNIAMFENVSDIFTVLKRNFKKTNNQPDVLITGSLHLVGAAIALLDQKLISCL